LLATAADQLSDYERVSLEAAREVTEQDIASARQRLDAYRRHVRGLFERFDVIVTPATAVPAFPLGERPETVAGRPVGKLWGAFPFTVPFNVSGQPAASIPCGFAASLPVGLQIVAADGNEGLLLDLSEDLEEALDFDRRAVQEQWSDQPSAARASL
jgi:aspartyl-tRNA(Asn)/glutamyl-tRNA(Gln) amidotransferase subunit A